MNVLESWSAGREIAAEGRELAQPPPKGPSFPVVSSRGGPARRLLSSSDPLAACRLMILLCAALGILSFAALLASHNIADWDLWAKLALGARVWHYGSLPQHDVFAFTPTLPVYVDHEWGAGVIFFGFLKYFGPGSLMWLKISLGCGTILMALRTGRRVGSDWRALFLLAVPAAGCVLFGYVPVIRSHAFTFFFFAVVLFCLEHLVSEPETKQPTTTVTPRGAGQISSGARMLPHKCGVPWPAVVLVGVMVIWVNIHGGFVAGLGTIGIYATVSLLRDLRREPVSITNRTVLLVMIAVASLAVTCINPYGVKFWSYLLPALAAKRELIREWQPLPLFSVDRFITFRLLFLLVLVCVLFGWKRVNNRSWGGIIMLAITALLAWRSRRHVPFFGVAALAFAGPYLEAMLTRSLQNSNSCWFVWPSFKRPEVSKQTADSPSPGPAEWNSAIQQTGTLRYGLRRGELGVAAVYVAISLYAAIVWVPQASWQVLAPIGDDPVREADILMRARAEGNLAVPFSWGSYAAWRLYPKVKISMDGRYEAAFPESTFQLNTDFFERRGTNWDRLIREHAVDYIILDLSQNRLRPEDLLEKGYVMIWQTPSLSALMALRKHAPRLLDVARDLPATTINPLDASVTANWW